MPKVRRQDRREPLFSLDPVDPQNMETTTQKKRPKAAMNWLKQLKNPLKKKLVFLVVLFLDESVIRDAFFLEMIYTY